MLSCLLGTRLDTDLSLDGGLDQFQLQSLQLLIVGLNGHALAGTPPDGCLGAGLGLGMFS